MDAQEAIKKLKKLVKKTNVNGCVDLAGPHAEADNILVNLIRELFKKSGQKDEAEEIAETFNKIKKWYE